ncbi:Stk1 family PASTA domain-containing Ser/Thr kinase [Erysipelothrix urinaevulpis]|uniref:Stk1 family PASTA domain-containing Ser/Thr kinase n=1 Tax=Erysipelothrix urinaevulpis TaxID=2683717 RepID=UPI00135CC634|nr:Stk1 family PASTA domain-containing Ser/Thr kinase [Erysipelothrix urinaevulpis]
MNRTIGNRYALMKKIGSGGMADVYLALDTVLEREVAVKILRGSLAHDPVALLRFQREAQAASGLDHENIVDVYDVGEDDGEHYIVMEVIHGTTLKSLIHRRGALDKYEAVSIMEQIAFALQKAHKKNVIHRDIKPQNILVKDDGTVKIADFGIALAGDALQLTKSDSVLGSVHYLAPECSRGEGASEQSDIYALGIVFYELLTGEAPYKGETAVEIAMKHMRDELPSIHDYNPSIPNSLINIVAKATHKNRLYRYRTMDEFVDDLKTSLDSNRKDEELWEPQSTSDDETIMIDRLHSLPQDSNDAKNPKKKKMKPWMIWTSIAVLSLLLIGLVFILTRPSQPKEIDMPDVEGLSLEETKDILTEFGLHVNPNYTYQYSDEHDNLHVIDSRPKAGSKVMVGSQVKLTLSQGKTFEIQDYKGKTLSEVQELLSGQNISIKTNGEYRKDMEPGLVIRQELLMPGDKVNPDQRREILLVVSSEASGVIPSNIVGMSLDNAQKTLSELGMKSSLEKLSVAGLSESQLVSLEYNVVNKTSPGAGSYYVQEGSNVVVLYYYDIKDKPKEKPNEEVVEEETNQNDNV